MAIDEALLETVRQPVLRLYSWEPGALSLGYFQDARTVDFALCAREGIDVVRRPTGGRAILHDQELTYSIVLPPQHRFTQVGVAESYRLLSGGLLRALTLLGLGAQLAKKPASGFGRPSPGQIEAGLAAACFDAPSWYELVVGGRKAVGSAQVRRKGALLQHGSIPLFLEAGRLFRLLRFRSEDNRERAKARLEAGAAGLIELAGRPITVDELASALIRGFEEALTIETYQDSLSATESQTAERLETKHRSAAWVKERKAEHLT
ncbi:MAG: lipoate--protein ligase family protein [Limnochordia bacterium]|jgi:lipoate-protein ligase A